MLLESGADTSAQCSWGSTPLHAAIKAAHLDVTALLLAAGAPVNQTDSSLNSPLHIAAREGCLVIVRALLRAGASVNALNCAQQTPLCFAAFFDHVHVVHALLDAGASLRALDALWSCVHSDGVQAAVAAFVQARALTALGCLSNSVRAARHERAAADGGTRQDALLLLPTLAMDLQEKIIAASLDSGVPFLRFLLGNEAGGSARSA